MGSIGFPAISYATVTAGLTGDLAMIPAALNAASMCCSGFTYSTIDRYRIEGHPDEVLSCCQICYSGATGISHLTANGFTIDKIAATGVSKIAYGNTTLCCSVLGAIAGFACCILSTRALLRECCCNSSQAAQSTRAVITQQPTRSPTLSLSSIAEIQSVITTEPRSVVADH